MVSEHLAQHGINAGLQSAPDSLLSTSELSRIEQFQSALKRSAPQGDC